MSIEPDYTELTESEVVAEEVVAEQLAEEPIVEPEPVVEVIEEPTTSRKKKSNIIVEPVVEPIVEPTVVETPVVESVPRVVVQPQSQGITIVRSNKTK